MTTTLYTVILRNAYTLTAAGIAASQIARLESNQLLRPRSCRTRTCSRYSQLRFPRAPYTKDLTQRATLSPAHRQLYGVRGQHGI